MNDDLKIIKERIYVEERIEEVLEALGCQHIKKEGMGSRYSASLPNGDNQRSVQVKINESLTTKVYSKAISGDIYNLVGYILFECETFAQLTKKLYECKQWLCQLLGYHDILNSNDINVEVVEKIDWNSWLRPIQKRRIEKVELNSKPNKIISETVLREFRTPSPNIWWSKEGINLDTQREFEVGFDLDSLRITFSVRNKDGKLIGVKGRYVGDNQYIQKERKYIYIYRCNKSIELFSLHRALPFILEKREVIVVEGAKTCMLAWKYGIRNIVSVEGDSLTPFQVQILRDLGLDIKIILAYDKDKDVKFVKQQAKTIDGRSVYGLYDKDGLFEGKDSPLDKGKDLWDKLYNECKYKIN